MHAISSSFGPRELPPGARVKHVSDRCRSAALGFAWGALSWGRRDLARWLVGPYASAVVRVVAGDTRGGARAERRRGERGPLDEVAVAEVVARAHAGVLDALRAASGGWWADDPSFAREMVGRGLVTGVVDVTGDIGYAPCDAPRMRLCDRARSLFVADFLTRPRDYERLAVCEDCGGVTFDLAASHEDCTRGIRVARLASLRASRRAAATAPAA